MRKHQCRWWAETVEVREWGKTGLSPGECRGCLAGVSTGETGKGVGMRRC